MINRFEILEIEFRGKEYKKGAMEIDDQALEVTFKAIKGPPILETIVSIGKKEILLEKVKYDEKNFPQFDEETIAAGSVSAIVVSENDRSKIRDLFAKPLFEAKNKIEKNLSDAEEQVRETLLQRADALENLTALRANPRKTLFTRSPEILADSENPIQAFGQKQQDATVQALAKMKNAMQSQTINQTLKQPIIATLQRLAISVGVAQNAVFKGTETDQKSAAKALDSIGLAMPQPSEKNYRSFTEETLRLFTQKMHQRMVEDQLGVVKCTSCGKYYHLNQENICSYCKTPRQHL